MNKKTQIEWLTSGYEFAHGKKPRGTGYWAFKMNAKGDPIFFQGSLTHAKECMRMHLSENNIAWAQVEICS